MSSLSIDDRSSEQQLRTACAELARRIRAGEQASASELLLNDPVLAENDDHAIELIYSEWVALGSLGGRPSPEAWLEGYPRWRTRLSRLLDLESVLHLDTAIADATQTGVTDDAGEPDVGEAYEVIRELGRGGMGVVHLARQVRLGRLVALKTILAGEFADTATDARFRTEAAAAAKLQHPSIVQIFESGERDGHPFLALEYVSGGTLADQLRAGPMAANAAALLLATLARAIDYAHAQGIVHRDLKPTNILLASGDPACPKIADFGLAKSVHAGGDSTQAGAVVGTPSYMSPEQATARKAGPPADIYALGAILYECLTGRPPFKGATQLETLDQVRSMDPVPPRTFQPAIPRDLETIALACLRKDPAKRYASAASLADDLQRFLDGRPIQARPVSVLERGLKWCRRRPLVSGLATGLVSLTACGLIILAFFWQRAEVARQKELDQRIHAEEKTGALAIVSARLNWMGSDLEAARASLEQCPPAFRNEEWGYLFRASRPPVMVIQEGEQDPGSGTPYADWLTFSRDGGGIAAIFRDRQVRAWNTNTGLQLNGYSGLVRSKTIAFPAADRIVIARMEPGPKRTPVQPGAPLQLLSIDAVDINTGQASSLLKAATKSPELSVVDHAGFVRISNDGVLAAIAGSGTLQIVELATKTELHRVSSNGLGSVTDEPSAIRQGNRIFEISDNSLFLTVQSSLGMAAIWDTQLRKVVRRISYLNGLSTMFTVAVHPGGTHIALRHSTPRIKCTLVIRGTSPDTDVVIPTAFRDVDHAVFSPDGRMIAARGNRDNFVTIWDVTTGQELFVLRGHRHNLTSMAYSPDGKHLAVGCASGRIAIWDVGDLGE